MTKTTFLLLAIVPLLVSCSTPMRVSDTVGPNPYRTGNGDADHGYLRVFSQLQPVTEGFDEGPNPDYYQHTDYRVYGDQGKLVKCVGNTVGKYDSQPRLVSLPPGHYVVKARAKDYLLVNVSVLIEPGHTTNVHLDDQWNPPAEVNRSDIVKEPNGSCVGWQASHKASPANTSSVARATAG